MNFVIVGIARSGSSYLTDALRKHPSILMHGELFQTENISWHIHPEVIGSLDMTLRQSDPCRFVSTVFANNAGRLHVGAKHLYGQNGEAMAFYCGNPSWAKIHLRRTNALAHYSSFLLADKTGVWNAHQDEELPPSPTLTFNSTSFLEFVAWHQECSVYFRNLSGCDSGRWLHLDYNPVNMDSVLSKALDFLALPMQLTGKPTLRRLHSNDIVSRFSNQKDVLRTLEAMGRLDWAQEL